MLRVVATSQYKKDFKKILRGNQYDIHKLEMVVEMLARQEQLPYKFKDHALSGNYSGLRECHIESDWLLVYKVIDDALILSLSRTGSHSDLFRGN